MVTDLTMHGLEGAMKGDATGSLRRRRRKTGNGRNWTRFVGDADFLFWTRFVALSLEFGNTERKTGFLFDGVYILGVHS